MITNMVYPEEINSDTYNEIMSQFETYGKVVDVKFFHFHDTTMPVEESVRVFIEFEK
jgi:hypothetical protein